MAGRTMIVLLALMLALGTMAAGAVAAQETISSEAVLSREDDWSEGSDEEDDDGSGATSHGGSGGFTSGVNSNDATNSRFTPVTYDKDRSRGDLTRDWTQDGAGGGKRDWSRHQTNDRSRNDSR